MLHVAYIYCSVLATNEYGMFDSNKRQSLLKLGGLIALPTASYLSSVALADAAAKDSIYGSIDDQQLVASADQYELRIELQLDDAPRMRVRNTSDQTVLVSQIRPGVVHTGKYAYNLNAVLSSKPVFIEAGQAKMIPIAVTDHASRDSYLDENLKKGPLRVAMVTADTPQGRLVHSTRAFYS